MYIPLILFPSRIHPLLSKARNTANVCHDIQNHYPWIQKRDIRPAVTVIRSRYLDQSQPTAVCKPQDQVKRANCHPIARSLECTRNRRMTAELKEERKAFLPTQLNTTTATIASYFPPRRVIGGKLCDFEWLQGRGEVCRSNGTSDKQCQLESRLGESNITDG